MTQDELIAEITDRLPRTLPKTAVKEVLKALAEVATHKVSLNEKVLIPNLVQISGVMKPARDGFNPRTREKLSIPERQVVQCKPAGNLKKLFDK